jgi:hypothetical protein
VIAASRTTAPGRCQCAAGRGWRRCRNGPASGVSTRASLFQSGRVTFGPERFGSGHRERR